MLKTLEQKIQSASSARKNKTKCAKELIDFLMKEKLRRPDLVCQYGLDLLASKNTSSNKHNSHEYWNLAEFIFLNALDLYDCSNNNVSSNCKSSSNSNENDKKKTSGNTTIAIDILHELKTKFPTSQRVRRLEGMLLEEKGDYDGANEVYKAIKLENPANSLVWKRQVCILKAQGKRNDAIVMLNALLTVFPTDVPSWQELAELHLAGSSYNEAAFCYEELVLSNPLNFLFHSRLAEIYLTIGGIDRARAARKHFCQSIELNPLAQNVRAQLGLWICTGEIASYKQPRKCRDEQALDDVQLNLNLRGHTMRTIQDHYIADSSTEISDLVATVLKSDLGNSED